MFIWATIRGITWAVVGQLANLVISMAGQLGQLLLLYIYNNNNNNNNNIYI